MEGWGFLPTANCRTAYRLLRTAYFRSGHLSFILARRVPLEGSRSFRIDGSRLDGLASLAMSPGAVKVTVHRLRQKYRETLRLLISQTVAVEDDIESELHVLLSALRGN